MSDPLLPSDPRDRRDVWIAIANLLMWLVLPTLSIDTGFGMWVSILTCIWRPFTSFFLIGLSESAFQDEAFRDVLFTPGRLVMAALLLRCLVQPGLSRTLGLLRGLPRWAMGGLLLYSLPILATSLLRDNSSTGYAALANVLSAIAIAALGASGISRPRLLMALVLGLLPASMYYFEALLGIAAPVTTFSSEIGYVMAAGRMNPNATARTIVLLILIALFMLQERAAGTRRTLALIAILSGLIAIPITASRGALIALSVGLVAALFTMPTRSTRTILLYAGSVLLLAALAAIFIPQLHDHWTTLRDLSQLSLQSAWDEVTGHSLESERRTLWAGAIEHIRRHPLFPDYQAYRNEWVLMTHNTFLETTLHGGILAGAGLIMLWVCSTAAAARYWWRHRLPCSAFFLVLLLSRFVSAFLTAAVGDKIFLMLVVLMALAQVHPAWWNAAGLRATASPAPDPLKNRP